MVGRKGFICSILGGTDLVQTFFEIGFCSEYLGLYLRVNCVALILIHGTFPIMRTVNDVVYILKVTLVGKISVLLFYSVEKKVDDRTYSSLP